MQIVIDIPDEQVKKSLEESKYIHEDEGEKGFVHISMLYTNAQLEFVDVERKTDFYSCKYKILPKGHGDLIDRNELLKEPMDAANYPSNYVRIAKAIIEADKESEESCDNCKHNTESWDSDACDGCCGANSKWSGECYPGEFEAMEHNGRLDALISEEKDTK